MNLQLAKNSYAYFVFHAGFFSETALGYRGAYFKQLLNKYLKWNGFFGFFKKNLKKIMKSIQSAGTSARIILARRYFFCAIFHFWVKIDSENQIRSKYLLIPNAQATVKLFSIDYF